MGRKKRSQNSSWRASSIPPMRKEACSERSRRNWKILLNQDCPSGLEMMKTVQWMKFPHVCGCCPLPLHVSERPSVDQWRASLGDGCICILRAITCSAPPQSQPNNIYSRPCFSKSSQSFVIHISVFFRGHIFLCSTLANRTVLH